MSSASTQPLVIFCDRPGSRLNLAVASVRAEFRVRSISSFASLPDLVHAQRPAVVVIGMSSTEEREAFAGIDRLRGMDPGVAIVLVAAKGSEALAVAALRAGAKDYFSEPYDDTALVGSIRRLTAPAGRPPRDLRPRGDANPLVGCSAILLGVDRYLSKVAERDVTVLITGETGTGKELAASVIHARSVRRAHRCVPVNCAAIPDTLVESELFGHEPGAFTGAAGARPGLLQLADRGTVFLDEVGDLGLVAQAKILRAIETREVYRVGGKHPIRLDVRIVAATNVDLERAVDEGRFRKDLFYRLNVACVHLPPLRERRADIKTLLDHYLQEFNSSCGAAVSGFSDEALAALHTYEWPGNVRELKNLLEAIFVSPPNGPVEMADLPKPFLRKLQRLSRLPRTERRRMVDALTAANWNKTQAAEMLNWSRMTLYRKMAKHSVWASDGGAARLRRNRS